MSQGIGTYQRALLEILAQDCPDGGLWWSIGELSAKLGRSPRQTIAAVRSLEARDLVAVGRSDAVRYVAYSQYPKCYWGVPGLIVAHRMRMTPS